MTETLAAAGDVRTVSATPAVSLYALRGGRKSVLSIDASGDALRIADENLTTNGLDHLAPKWQEADVFSWRCANCATRP